MQAKQLGELICLVEYNISITQFNLPYMQERVGSSLVPSSSLPYTQLVWNYG